MPLSSPSWPGGRFQSQPALAQWWSTDPGSSLAELKASALASLIKPWITYNCLANDLSGDHVRTSFHKLLDESLHPVWQREVELENRWIWNTIGFHSLVTWSMSRGRPEQTGISPHLGQRQRQMTRHSCCWKIYQSCVMYQNLILSYLSELSDLFKFIKCSRFIKGRRQDIAVDKIFIRQICISSSCFSNLCSGDL